MGPSCTANASRRSCLSCSSSLRPLSTATDAVTRGSCTAGRGGGGPTHMGPRTHMGRGGFRESVDRTRGLGKGAGQQHPRPRRPGRPCNPCCGVLCSGWQHCARRCRSRLGTPNPACVQRACGLRGRPTDLVGEALLRLEAADVVGLLPHTFLQLLQGLGGGHLLRARLGHKRPAVRAARRHLPRVKQHRRARTCPCGGVRNMAPYAL